MNTYHFSLDGELFENKIFADPSYKEISISGNGTRIIELSKLDRVISTKIETLLNPNQTQSDWRKSHNERLDKFISLSKEKIRSSEENSVSLERLFSKLKGVENIKEIRIWNANLEYFPTLLENFLEVEKIDFYDCTIGFFKEEITRASKLRIINFSLSYLREFPKNLAIYPRLEHFLFLSPICDSIVKALRFNISLMKLEDIDPMLSEESVNAIEMKSDPVEANRLRFKKWKFLLSQGIAKELRDFRRQYSSLQFRKLPTEIKFGEKLKTLSIKGTQCRKLPASLFIGNQLKRINLFSNRFCNLPFYSKENRTLLYLDLSGNRFKANDEFFQKLKGFKKLRYLSINDEISSEDLEILLSGGRFAIIKTLFKVFYFNELKKKRNQRRVRRLLG
jgi:hypothetical protein